MKKISVISLLFFSFVAVNLQGVMDNYYPQRVPLTSGEVELEKEKVKAELERSRLKSFSDRVIAQHEKSTKQKKIDADSEMFKYAISRGFSINKRTAKEDRKQTEKIDEQLSAINGNVQSMNERINTALNPSAWLTVGTALFVNHRLLGIALGASNRFPSYARGAALLGIVPTTFFANTIIRSNWLKATSITPIEKKS